MTAPLEKICDSFTSISEKLDNLEDFIDNSYVLGTLKWIQELIKAEHAVLLAYIGHMRYRRQHRRKKYRQNVQSKKCISNQETEI